MECVVKVIEGNPVSLKIPPKAEIKVESLPGKGL
jgi:hypothetical protein